MKLPSTKEQVAAAVEAEKPAPKPETQSERLQRVWYSAQSSLHPDLKELLSVIIEFLPEPEEPVEPATKKNSKKNDD